MTLNLATPALLFPAISLLFISYTNRFVSYANLVRRLHEQWRHDGSHLVQRQIDNLRHRIRLIRNMQMSGAASLFLSVVSMVLVVMEVDLASTIVFVAALALLLVSLALLLWEVAISTAALDTQLNDMCGAEPGCEDGEG